MKLILIKIGKALSTLKKDGIFRGGKRITSAFFAMFRRVRSGDVLFITGGVGDSARYRTNHAAEELTKQNLKCSITVQDNPFLTTYADKFKIFIFHRVLFTLSVAKLIEKIKKQKKEIIFETDDLVFDPKFLQYMDYYNKMNAFEKKLYENGVGGEILKDEYVKTCVTTTSFLAEKLKEYGKKVFIAPNKLSDRDLEIAEKIIERENLARKTVKKNCPCCFSGDSTIKIGYFSGTVSHNKDFASVTDALIEIMKKYPQTELYLVGPLDTESKLNEFKNRIKKFPYVQREKHFENIAQMDINLAPLEIGNPFCEAKSELKFFEAGIVGVPTVASATGTFKKAIDDGIDGFTANSAKEWMEKLEKLVLDEKLRKEMGQKAREKTLTKYTNKNSDNQEYYNYLKSKL